MSEQGALFEATPPGRALLPEERIYPGEATWTRWKGSHQPCGICVRLVIEKGIGQAPPIAPGTWKRKGPNGDTFVCSPHMQELKPQDDAVVEKLKKMRQDALIPRQRKAAGQRRYGS